MNDVPPQLFEVEWDHQQVAQLLDDLSSGADIQHVQVRIATDDGPRDLAVSLAQAKQHLDSGAARAIQIRYAFDGQSWCDTLMVMPTTIRIIRTVLPGTTP